VGTEIWHNAYKEWWKGITEGDRDKCWL